MMKVASRRRESGTRKDEQAIGSVHLGHGCYVMLEEIVAWHPLPKYGFLDHDADRLRGSLPFYTSSNVVQAGVVLRNGSVVPSYCTPQTLGRRMRRVQEELADWTFARDRERMT